MPTVALKMLNLCAMTVLRYLDNEQLQLPPKCAQGSLHKQKTECGISKLIEIASKILMP